MVISIFMAVVLGQIVKSMLQMIRLEQVLRGDHLHFVTELLTLLPYSAYISAGNRVLKALLRVKCRSKVSWDVSRRYR